ncbi:MAG: glutathione S-transferase family protein [Hyphomicrobiales bacterium]|nr:glutathione S-transferase family protein [Hyphomicrobiales bacterium]
MMILRSAPPSPFGRKVKLAVAILGLDREIEIKPADTNDAGDNLRSQNPLGKIPVLVLEDGSAVYDSRVILEYLDHRAGGGKIVPLAGAARIAVLRQQALCDGILDASILQVYEGRWRPKEKHEQKWVDYQADKVKRGLAVLESDPPGLDALPHVGQITAACVLGYQDLRFGGVWRAAHPKLVAWLDKFAAKVPAFEKTKVTP